jgi:phosphoribosylaminoimidazolecarboxamide formyltransferase/IMP cyclohydrolase
MAIRRALLTVYDKTNIIELGRKLREFDVEIVSTGGTMKELRKGGVEVKSVSDITGFPEILDGRVKTLHPKIHGGILARRDKGEHVSQLSMHNILLFDLVVVNLYPFEKVISSSEVSEEIALENIDVGGPTMIRSAAKNFPHVTVITSPDHYAALIEELAENNGATSLEFRSRMARTAFERTAAYDAAIASWFKGDNGEFPGTLNLNYNFKSRLRYGENPHQKAALYEKQDYPYSSVAGGKLLSGKELSFNNLWDLEAALQMALDFDEPFAAVIKHTNPCGAAIGTTLSRAYEKALASDPLSAFGSVIALNRRVDMETAKLLHETQFVECILAPGFEPEAFDLLEKKKGRRLVDVGELSRAPETDLEFRPVAGGILAQTQDRHKIVRDDLQFITDKQPTDEQIEELLFAFKIVKHIKSNAIVICKNLATVGVGAGQTSRVDSSIIAVRKAGGRAQGAVAASDAFFPMPDGLERLGEAGVTAVIQPGVSKKDPEVIEAANRLGIAMVLTGIRHFKH